MLLYLIKALLFVVGGLAIALPFILQLRKKEGSISWKIKGGGILIGTILIGSSFGWYYIPEKHSGQVTLKVGDPLPSGRLIAITSNGERGLQSEVINPGYNYSLKYPFVMEIAEVKDFQVPPGKFAVLTARDGEMTPHIVARKWDNMEEKVPSKLIKSPSPVVTKMVEDEDGNMVEKQVTMVSPEKMLLDVDYFIANGGQRGVQQHILTTGVYRLNRHLWTEIKLENLTEVKANEVLVIESKFGEAPAFTQTSDDEILSVPLVKSTDYRGIVNKAYPSGFYAIHPRTQSAHKVSIVLETYIYGGGYSSDIMDLSIDPENDKLITNRDTKHYTAEKDGSAFSAKTKDNHTVYYDVRVLGQIEPVQAPRFVGTIRDPKVLDDKVIEPFTRNILSNITLEYTALDLKDKKKEIGERVSELLRERTIKTGFRTKTVEITNIDIPAIVLIPGKIESASIALKQALTEKEKSVQQAIKVRNMQDQADNQEELAKATVKNQASDQEAAAIIKISAANLQKSKDEADAKAYLIDKETQANKQRIEETAKAYGELVKAIGKDNASAILLQETINDSAEKYNVPEVVVFGSESSDGSIVPAHMISKSIQNSLKTSVK